jgi:hypothetical protein
MAHRRRTERTHDADQPVLRVEDNSAAIGATGHPRQQVGQQFMGRRDRQVRGSANDIGQPARHAFKPRFPADGRG